jgi:hypothetical protein
MNKEELNRKGKLICLLKDLITDIYSNSPNIKQHYLKELKWVFDDEELPLTDEEIRVLFSEVKDGK